MEGDMRDKRSGLLGAALLLAFAVNSAEAQISDQVVKLGVLNDMSSLLAGVSGKGSVLAAHMAAEDFGGTVRGVPIEILSADHQNKADIGAGIARAWIDVDDVDAIVDGPTSSVALAVQQVAREQQRIFLMSGAATSDLTGKACSPTASNGPSTPMRSLTAPELPWFGRAATPGSCWCPTMPPAMRSSAMPRRWSRRRAARFSAACTIPSTPRISPRTSCRPGPRAPR
jgi:substrate-binding family protein